MTVRNVLVCDLGGTRLRVAVATPEGSIHSKKVTKTPPGDPDALATTLQEALGDVSRLGAYGERGRDMVATRFSLPGMIEAHQQLYQELVMAKLGVSSPVGGATS